MKTKPDINALNSIIKKATDEVKEYVRDTSIPLEDRWGVWISCPKTPDMHRGYVASFIGIPEDYFGYDMPLHVERHGTVTVEDIEETAIEGYDERGVLSVEDLNKFKEDALSRCIYSFTYDW